MPRPRPQTLPARLAGLALVLAGWPAAPAQDGKDTGDGVVRTRDARLPGAARIAGDGVRLGDRRVAWDDVLWMRLRDVRPGGGPAEVLLPGDEAWRVAVPELAGGELRIRSEHLGEREVDVAHLAAIVLAPGTRKARVAPGDPAKGRLLTTEGKEVPGELLFLDAERAGVASPFGTLRMPRERVVRYDFPARAPPSGPADEVGLVDGSVLRGGLRPVDGAFALEHRLLGRLRLPARDVAWLLRSGDGSVDLAGLPPAAAHRHPIVFGEVDTRPPPVLRAGDPGAGPAVGVRAVRLEPPGDVRWSFEGLLPEGAGRRFTARLAPAPETRGDLRVTLRSGGKTVLERELRPEGKPVAVDVALPALDLEVEVELGRRLLFPAALLIADPHVAAAAAAGDGAGKDSEASDGTASGTGDAARSAAQGSAAGRDTEDPGER